MNGPSDLIKLFHSVIERVLGSPTEAGQEENVAGCDLFRAGVPGR